MCVHCEVDCGGACVCCHPYKAAIIRIEELHKPIILSSGRVVCNVCEVYTTDDEYPESITYPCDTIKALEGEQ
jgi:hypothetical protein